MLSVREPVMGYAGLTQSASTSFLQREVTHNHFAMKKKTNTEK
jgi:hypothetical protein